MTIIRRLNVPLLVLFLSAPGMVRTAAAASPPPAPIPIAGGDGYTPGFPFAIPIHQFVPGPSLDGVNAEPNGITNFRGLAAMAYTSGVATDNTGRTYAASTDIRLYRGEYVGQDGRHARGTFVEIWIDLFDPSSGSPLHDISPGNGQSDSGVFWLLRVPDNAVTIRGTTVTVQVHSVAEIDQHAFFDPDPPYGAVPSVASFTMSYTRSGSPHLVRPTTSDPNSATNWAGVMWTATGSATFSVAYTDGTFAFRDAGPTSSAGQFGEIGFERNGVFVPH